MDGTNTGYEHKINSLDRSGVGKLIDTIVIAILLIIGVFLEFQVVPIEPNQQYIPGDDLQIFGYPDLADTINTAGSLALIGFPWLGVVGISTLSLFFAKDTVFSWREWRCRISAMLRMILFAYGATLTTTDCMKLYCGSLRPYFLAVRGSDDELKARLSFPSGHSSSSMAMMALLSLSMADSWKCAQRMFHMNSQTIKFVPSLRFSTSNPHSLFLCRVWWALRETPIVGILMVAAPTSLAVWCGMTRIRDYKHFASDVVAGWIVGAVWAFIAKQAFQHETYTVFEYGLGIEMKKAVADSKGAPNVAGDTNAEVILEEIIVEQQIQ